MSVIVLSVHNVCSGAVQENKCLSCCLQVNWNWKQLPDLPSRTPVFLPGLAGTGIPSSFSILQASFASLFGKVLFLLFLV